MSTKPKPKSKKKNKTSADQYVICFCTGERIIRIWDEGAESFIDIRYYSSAAQLLGDLDSDRISDAATRDSRISYIKRIMEGDSAQARRSVIAMTLNQFKAMLKQQFKAEITEERIKACPPEEVFVNEKDPAPPTFDQQSEQALTLLQSLPPEKIQKIQDEFKLWEMIAGMLDHPTPADHHARLKQARLLVSVVRGHDENHPKKH